MNVNWLLFGKWVAWYVGIILTWVILAHLLLWLGDTIVIVWEAP